MEKANYGLQVGGLTYEQVQRAHIAIAKILHDDEEKSVTDISKLKSKSKNPAPTVSDDEDEDFGTTSLKAKDLEDDEDAEEIEEDEVEEKTTRARKSVAKVDDEDDEGMDDETDDAEPSVSFKEVRAALNKYGEKHPDQAKAILAGFNLKSPKELSAKQNEKYYEPIYRKVMAKLKGLKKK